MDQSLRVAFLGFLPWTDEARQVRVVENPAGLAAARAAAVLAERGLPAIFVPMAVSSEGIQQALAAIRAFDAPIVVALGQTRTEPRIERYGRVPGAFAPAGQGEAQPWELAPDADELARMLGRVRVPGAGTAPVRASDDAGAYFCDHLCVELVRESRASRRAARFLHVTAIDGCEDPVREARVAEYTAQALAIAEYLRARANANA